MLKAKSSLSKIIIKVKDKSQLFLIFALIMISVLVSGCEDQAQSDMSEASTSLGQEVVQEVDEQKEDNLDKEVPEQNTSTTSKEMFLGFETIEVDGGDLSGYRQANVVVDIGYGDREYWAYTNQYGQLVKVIANEIIPQNDSTEPVNSSGRYYPDGAKVPGVESDSLDEGHVIADSLGGVSNAYNITPQDSTLNRHGDQAYMEKVIRDAGGCTNFEAIITYPNTETQIPSKYKYTYTLRDNVIVDEFENVNPDEYNRDQGITEPVESNSQTESSNQSEGDLSSIDTNGNGKVTIKEAKSAGFNMPIKKGHWLYEYMDDRDGDGMVGE